MGILQKIVFEYFRQTIIFDTVIDRVTQRKEQLNMRVFHGGAIEVKDPEIRTGKFTKDFGEGFYCTKLKRQAKRWAMRKETPTISIYEYTPNKALTILDFKGMTDAWLDFIVNCRKGIPHNYDIVIGAMANDQIYNHIESETITKK